MALIRLSQDQDLCRRRRPPPERRSRQPAEEQGAGPDQAQPRQEGKLDLLAGIVFHLTTLLQTVDLFASLANKDPEKYNELWTKAAVALKLGAIDDTKNRPRMVKLLRFETSASANLSSLDDVVARRKKGQTQIFFIASVGEKKAALEKSPFVERIIARGYEVLYFGEPMDEMLVSSIGSYEGLKFQDVAKKGFKFGDEGAFDSQNNRTAR